MTAEEFRAARVALNMTKRALARRWRVHEQTVYSWEAGHHAVPGWCPDAFRGIAALAAQFTGRE